MDRNVLEIHAAPDHGMGSGASIVLNGVELDGVRRLELVVDPGELVGAVITFRIDDLHAHGATIKVLKDADNAKV